MLPHPRLSQILKCPTPITSSATQRQISDASAGKYLCIQEEPCPRLKMLISIRSGSASSEVRPVQASSPSESNSRLLDFRTFGILKLLLRNWGPSNHPDVPWRRPQNKPSFALGPEALRPVIFSRWMRRLHNRVLHPPVLCSSLSSCAGFRTRAGGVETSDLPTSFLERSQPL